MKAPHYSSSSPRPAACDVAAHAWVRVPAERLPDLRRRPGPGFNELPAGALKQADEQTVAGIAAVAHAMHQHGLDSAAFHSWGVLAAPYYMGRPAMAAALQRYRGEGAWGASPHLPPHRSLHSPSGAISQLFKMHGPNYGVGGGPGCAAEVLMAAAALLDAERVPGVWVVMSAIDPDLPPDRDGGLPTGAACVALALALTPPRAPAGGIRLRVAAAAGPVPPPTLDSAPALDLFGLKAVLDALSGDPDCRRVAFILPLEAGGRVEIERFGAARLAASAGAAAADARLLSPIPLAETRR